MICDDANRYLRRDMKLVKMKGKFQQVVKLRRMLTFQEPSIFNLPSKTNKQTKISYFSTPFSDKEQKQWLQSCPSSCMLGL